MKGYSFVGYVDSASDATSAEEEVLAMWSAALPNLCAGTLTCELFRNIYGSHCYAQFDVRETEEDCDNVVTSYTNNAWFTSDVGTWHFVEVDTAEVSDPFTQLPANLKWLKQDSYTQMIMYNKCDLPCPSLTSSLSISIIPQPSTAPVNLTIVYSDTKSATIMVAVEQSVDSYDFVGFKLYIDGVRWPTYATIDTAGYGFFELSELAFGERTFALTASYFTCSGEGPQSTPVML
jgi:hypothetical protein